MKSFGIGKKQQARSEEPKRLPPTATDLTHLLSTSQKSPDRPFTLSWRSPVDQTQYTLTVVNSAGQKDRRGWSSSAIDNAGGNAAEWKLHSEVDGERTELFCMQSSDAYLIMSVIDEVTVQGAPLGELSEQLGSSNPQSNLESPQGLYKAPTTSAPAAPSASSGAQPAPAVEPISRGATGTGTTPYQEGSLRQTPIRTILEAFRANKTTGRLICDIGTVTAEVFLTDGEPVHAKSCHSLVGDRDQIGEVVLVDLLTWKEGDFKFQLGWAAATRTITSSLESFLSGTTTGTSSASAAPAATATSAVAAAPASSSASAASHSHSPDDFSNVDDEIGEMYASIIEKSGLLKYGMFLMLARTEFGRYEIGKHGFCIAAIGLEMPVPDRELSDEALQKIGECFEPVGQPLDILAFSSRTRLYALFPHSTGAVAATSLKHFLNNIQSTPSIDTNLSGSAIKVSVGLCEVPRDGTDFQEIMELACKLRRSATPEKRIVISAG